MSEQSNNNAAGGNQGPGNSNNNNNRRHNNRRRHHNRPQGQGNSAAGNAEPRNNQQQRPAGQGPQQARQPNPHQNNQNNNQRRRPHHNNRPRREGQPGGQQQQGGGGFSIERIYEKYLNLLDQHIIARRKYHDLFYRADPAQKAKLERNFYNTLNDVREFENKLAPDVKVLFEKRNNGLKADRTYTSNHEIPIEGDEVPSDIPPAEPHLLQSQIAADYSKDTEESVGTAEDYLKYKGL